MYTVCVKKETATGGKTCIQWLLKLKHIHRSNLWSKNVTKPTKDIGLCTVTHTYLDQLGSDKYFKVNSISKMNCTGRLTGKKDTQTHLFMYSELFIQTH